MARSYPFRVDAPAAALTNASEAHIQSAFVGRLRMFAPEVRYAASLNGLRTSMRQAVNARKTGMSKGFPDMLCLWLGGAGFVEFKAKVGPLGEEQLRWLVWLHEAGFNVAVCRHPDSALAALESWGAPLREGWRR